MMAKEKLNLTAAIDNWSGYLSHFSPKTKKGYLCVIQQFSEFCPQDIRGIKLCHVQAYLADLGKRTENLSSIASYTTCLKSFFKYLTEELEIPNIGSKIKIIKAPQTDSRVISPEEYIKLLKAIKGLDKDLIVFLANTGIRANECNCMTWNNLSPDNQYIVFNGKGNKKRSVPLNEICQKIISKYRKKNKNGDGFIPFLHRYSSPCNFHVLCKRLSKKANIPMFGMHAFRHFFATRLLRNNVGIYKVAKLLGHSSVTTTEKVYAHLVPQDLKGITDCLEN